MLYINELQKQKILCSIFLLIILCMIQLTYIQSAIPPQMGWWNYYGWQLNEGKLLYKDIFCFLPPYFPWFMGLLYNIFGIHLFNYQIIGLLFNYIDTLLVFILLCNLVTPLKSMLACAFGNVLQYSYLVYFPFDYNQIIFFLVINFIYFFIKGIDIKTKKLFIFSGIFLGLFIMTKQTGIIYTALVIVFWILYFFKKHLKKEFLKNIICLLCGILIAILPGIFYLLSTNTFSPFFNQIVLSASSKGSVLGMIVRFYQYGFSYTEFIIGLILFFNVFNNKNIFDRSMCKYNISFKWINIYIFSILIVYKVCKIFVTQMNLLPDLDIYRSVYKYIPLIFFMLSIGFLCIYILYKISVMHTKLKIEIELKCLQSLMIIISGMTLCIIIYLIENHGFSARELLYKGGVVFAIKRSIVNVVYWFSFDVVVYYFVKYILRKENIVNKIIFSFISLYFLFITLSIMSSIIEELYIMPLFATFLCLFFNKYTAIIDLMIIVLGIFIVFVTITQKQVVPYIWHGWKSTGLKNDNLQYTYSDINGLQGYVLDNQTEIAYENIIDVIETYSTSDDIVYEFPHITLFNVLTKRNLGVFSVTDYFDVCPDYVADIDAKYLYNKLPSIVIWDELGENSWDINEKYFRDGKFSGQRKIKNFYENVVKKNYKLVYSYKEISVWVKNTSNYSNFILALNRLKRYSKYYNHQDVLDILNNCNMEDYNYIFNSKDVYSVDECVASILKKNNFFDEMLTDDDYKDYFSNKPNKYGKYLNDYNQIKLFK